MKTDSEKRELSIIYQGLHGLDLTRAMQGYAKERVLKLCEHSQKIQSVTFSFSCRDTNRPEERMKVRARLCLQGRIFTEFNAKAKAADMYKAIDAVVDIFERKLRRRKRLLGILRKAPK